MIRARARRIGAHRAAILAAAIVVLGGCASAAPTAPSGTPVGSSPVPTDRPAVVTPDPTAEPAQTTSAEPVATPVRTPRPARTPAPEAAACTGSDANREFYAAVAAKVDWTVYCPVLPDGWFVESGTYRLSGGERLEIVYKGPSGARLELHEGAFCPEGGCVPDGSDSGSAELGDRDGSLVAVDDGSWAIVADDSSGNEWLLVGSGFDEASFRDVAAALAIVGP